MILQASQPSSLLGQCIRGCRGKKLADVLAGHAVDVVLAQRILGSRAAAKQLGIILFDYPDMSATPVETVVSRVQSGEIPMTEAQLREAALADETATKFLAQNPWLTDPTGKSIPHTKGRRPAIKDTAPAVPAPPVEPASLKKPKPAVAIGNATVESPEPAPEAPTSVSFEATPDEEIQDDAPLRRKRKSVEMPPDYKPEDFIPKPPPPLKMVVCGLPATD